MVISKYINILFQSVNRFHSSVMEFCESSSLNISAPVWLNKQFIEHCLRLGYKDSKLSVTRFNIAPATAPGDNYVSELYRVTTELLNDDKERSVIMKCLPTSEYNLKFIQDAKLFEKEIHFYNKTLSALSALHLAPHCLYTREDLLVLEDLSPMGFKVVSRLEGLDLEHSRAAIKTLASLHAHSLSIPASELASSYPETVYHDKEHAYRYIHHSLTSLAGIVQSWEGFQHFAKRIYNLSETVLDQVLTLMPSSVLKDSEHFFVLNHGDFWTNNMMFRYNGSEVVEVKLLDFQMCRFAPLALDLQYFLCTSLCEEDQIISDNILLEEYRVEFCRILQQEDYLTANQLESEMSRTNIFGFLNACMMLPVVLSDPTKDSPDLGNVAESIPKDSNTLQWHTGSLFKRRFQQLLLHFEAKGLFV